MSRMYFHSEHEDTEVRGWERARAGYFCTELLATALHIDDEYEGGRPSPLRRVVTGYVRTTAPRDFARTLRTWLNGFGDSGFVLGTESVGTFTAALNTALVMGSDPIRLMARLHGQCELHCYVEGPNRAWLADIIERGRKAGIMRAESGWEETIALLRSRDDGPVVTSYSVCEQFPHPRVARWEPSEDEEGEENWDTWYDLPEDERWRMGIEGLRSGSMGKGLEMSPATWEDYHFGGGVTGFMIREYANELAADTSA